jgi:hypothetical protein
VRASAVVNCQRLRQADAFGSFSSAVTRWTNVWGSPTGGARQPRCTMLISISAMLSQLPCLGV